MGPQDPIQAVENVGWNLPPLCRFSLADQAGRDEASGGYRLQELPEVSA